MSKTSEKAAEELPAVLEKEENQSVEICGIIMPISSIDNCPESHWKDVASIIDAAALSAGFKPRIVSNSDDVGVIHKRIVENLYLDPIVVCDVSCKNANVMFELGMRLAFDKPTVIIKDDKTSYSFDTSGIEHLDYPRDLRYGTIEIFKQKLAEKIKATYQRSKEPGANTFLKNFGDFIKVAKIDQKEVPAQNYIISELDSIKILLRKMGAFNVNSDAFPSKENLTIQPVVNVAGKSVGKAMTFNISSDWSPQKIKSFKDAVGETGKLKSVSSSSYKDGSTKISVIFNDPEEIDMIKEIFYNYYNIPNSNFVD